MRFALPAVVAATILLVLVAGLVPAHADRIIINWQDGSGFDSGVFPESRAVLNNHVYDSVVSFPVGTAVLGLMEPDGSLSDVLEVTHSIFTEVCILFCSGPFERDVSAILVFFGSPNLADHPPDRFTFETGQLQDVSGFFGAPAGTALVQSDLVQPVPEPATTTLLLLGAGGLALARRVGRSRG